MLFILADSKTTRSFPSLGEEVDVDSEIYCWRRSGVFWRIRASLGLACGQAATLCAQVVGQPSEPDSRSAAGTIRTSEGTGADLRFPRLCLPLDRSENVENQIMKFKSISHTYPPSTGFRRNCCDKS